MARSTPKERCHDFYKNPTWVQRGTVRSQPIELYRKLVIIIIILLCRMAELDASNNTLNLSSSKQKYSFPKTKRFQSNGKPLCDQLYSIPNTISKRATMLGYGNKTMGNDNKIVVPGVGTYTYQSQINPQKNARRSISFGVGREDMELGGPLGNVKKFLQKLPAPGTYEAKNVRDHRAPALRSRLPDRSLESIGKNPGPGMYQHQQFGKNSYYLMSKYKNNTNVKISQVSRLQPLSNRKSAVGPSDYQPVDTLNPPGRYNLAKHKSTVSCVFSRSLRKGIEQKGIQMNPGPGQYKSFSGFG